MRVAPIGTWMQVMIILGLSLGCLPAYAEKRPPVPPLPLIGTEALTPTKVRGAMANELMSPAEAEIVAGILTQEGFGPIWTVEEGDLVWLVVGRCNSLTDATLIKLSLAERGFENFRQKAFPNSPPVDFESVYRTPDPPVLGSPPRKPDPDSSALIEGVASPDTMARLEAALRSREPTGAIKEAKELAANLSDADPAKGALVLRSAIAEVRRDRKAKPSLPALLAVASGKIAATDADLRAARWAYADAIHYYLLDPLQAYRAYHEILAEAPADDHATRARALVEITACRLELALRQKAYFNEVRRSARVLLETVPEEYERARAVAALMYCETFFFEKNWDKALEAYDVFDAHFAHRPRELMKAKQYRGLVYCQVGRFSEAIDIFESILATPQSDPLEAFYWEGAVANPKPSISQWLLWCAEKSADAEAAARHMESIASKPWEAEDRDLIRMAHEALEQDLSSFDTAFPHAFYEESTAQ